MDDLEQIAYSPTDWQRKRKYSTLLNTEKSDRYEEVWLKEFKKAGFVFSVPSKKGKNPERIIVSPFTGGIEIKTIFGDEVEAIKNNNVIQLSIVKEIERKTQEKIEDAREQLTKCKKKILILVYGLFYGFKNSSLYYTDQMKISKLLESHTIDVVIFSVAPISLNGETSWEPYPPVIYFQNQKLEKYLIRIPFKKYHLSKPS